MSKLLFDIIAKGYDWDKIPKVTRNAKTQLAEDIILFCSKENNCDCAETGEIDLSNEKCKKRHDDYFAWLDEENQRQAQRDKERLLNKEDNLPEK